MKTSAPDTNAVLSWLIAGWLIPLAEQERQPTQHSRTLIGQTDHDVLFVTRDARKQDWIHKNLIRK